MNLVQIAKERCANWNDSNGRCFGISAEVLRGEPGTIKALDHCKLKDGERCSYFERCVLPGIPKQERANIHYGLELEKVAILAQRNQQVSEAKSPSRTDGVKKSKTTKQLLKTKEYVKTRLKAGRAS
jgi:hypothetical protein